MKIPLTEDNLSLLNDKQREIVLTQWEKHQHKSHEVDYDVSGRGDIFEGFEVHENVFCPFLSSAQYIGSCLFYNNPLFDGGDVIDMGSGTGILGVVMAKYGARRVVATDISKFAVANTKANVKKFDLEDKVKIIQGDLFENIEDRADLIVWNIPFFSGYAPKGDTISASMMMAPELFERFLTEAKDYLKPDGSILVPSYSLGGDLTNPRIVGKELGYDTKTLWRHDSKVRIQRGMLYVDQLRVRE
jgi:16S rRNA G1207 methylase RsmC